MAPPKSSRWSSSASKHTSRPCGRAVYDPGAHVEFVTGFRRRKQARRVQAAKENIAADKQARRDARKERRSVLRRTADRARGIESSSEDEKAEGDQRYGVDEQACANVDNRITRVYDGADESIVTTVVAPIQTFADSNFQSRLPRKRNANTTSKVDAPRRISTRRAGDESMISGSNPQELPVAVGRKLTHSGAKKLSKSNRYSRIAKIRRNRKRGNNG
jgi:hypothetical protein